MSMAKTKNLCILLLRLLAFGVTLSAAIAMATTHEKVNIFMIEFEAKYSDSPAMKYFVIANALASVYGLLVPFVPSESVLGQLVLVMDLVFTMLLTSSTSAALAIAYVGKRGNSQAGWLPICSQVPKYCKHASGALAAGFIGTIIYMAIVLCSIHMALNPLLVQKA
ncbi:hypothetical protein L1049_024445 [Liquidambar formosana]|uniref:CASP-like protein n=1 Tax=Liquidambar formosana TaxID=63359 RepID=A0AAP0RVJ2_LIQFO